ncbi:MAG: hypothetical protein WAM14_12905 [Candidatus Nitrosopolaris sp.]
MAVFCEGGPTDNGFTGDFANIPRFIQYRKERFERKEIAATSRITSKQQNCCVM